MLRLALITTLTLAFGCAKDAKDGEAASAKVELENATTAAFYLDETKFTPSVLKAKVIDMRLLTEQDSVNNPAPIVWTNAECPSSETETEIDGKMYKYRQSAGCNINTTTSYIDLAEGTDKINELMNSQNLPVFPGTFKFVTITFCEGSPSVPNAAIKADGMEDEEPVTVGTCGFVSAEADPPIVIAEGESVVVSLAYDLVDTIYDYGDGMTKSDNCYFNDDETVRRCLDFPVITPSFRKGE